MSAPNLRTTALQQQAWVTGTLAVGKLRSQQKVGLPEAALSPSAAFCSRVIASFQVATTCAAVLAISFSACFVRRRTSLPALESTSTCVVTCGRQGGRGSACTPALRQQQRQGQRQQDQGNRSKFSTPQMSLQPSGCHF